jgi:hypothetical protein
MVESSKGHFGFVAREAAFGEHEDRGYAGEDMTEGSEAQLS